jgi:hypothetical protein
MEAVKNKSLSSRLHYVPRTGLEPVQILLIHHAFSGTCLSIQYMEVVKNRSLSSRLHYVPRTGLEPVQILLSIPLSAGRVYQFRIWKL